MLDVAELNNDQIAEIEMLLRNIILTEPDPNERFYEHDTMSHDGIYSYDIEKRVILSRTTTKQELECVKYFYGEL